MHVSIATIFHVIVCLVIFPTLKKSQGLVQGQFHMPIHMTVGMQMPMAMAMPAPMEPCSCEVECCDFPWEMRRQSDIFHMPMVMRLDCCGCVDCPTTLNAAAKALLPQQPAPIIQVETPEPPEPPEIEIEYPEPGDVEPPEIENENEAKK